MMATPCSTDSNCERYTQWCNNGSCVCREVFGLAGPNCMTATTASKGSAAFLATGLAVIMLIIIYHVLTLLQLILVNSDKFKMNLAGRMYSASWVSLLLNFTSMSMAVAAPFFFLNIPFLIVDYVAILFQIYALNNLVVGFLKFTMMKQIKHRRWFNDPSMALGLVATALFIALIITVDFSIACFTMAATFLLTTGVAAVAPFALFYHSIRVKKSHTRSSVLLSALQDVISNNDAIYQVMTLEESRTSLTGLERNNSREDGLTDGNRDVAALSRSRGSSFIGFTFTRHGSFVTDNSNAMNDPIAKKGSSISLTTLVDRQRKKAEFFRRSMVAGIHLLLNGICFLIFWFIFETYSRKSSTSMTYTLPAVFWTCRGIFLALSSHVILNFSSHVYRKSIREKISDRKSRRNLDMVARGAELSEDSPRAAIPSWVKANTLANKRPLSTVDGKSSNHDMRGASSDHGLAAKTSGKRIVDEETRESKSRGNTVVSLRQAADKPGITDSGILRIDNEVGGVVDVWVDEVEEN